MNLQEKAFTILMANDDEDVCFLVEEALREVAPAVSIYFVENGEQLLDYLSRRNQYQDTNSFSFPDLIILDLNMPKIDGREALALLKSDPKFRRIPAVILTTSHREGDIINCYELGVNSFIVKPATFRILVEVMQSICRYWFDVVTLPDQDD